MCNILCVIKPFAERPGYFPLSGSRLSRLRANSMADYEAFLYSFGDPIGYGLALKHLERVYALVVQNGNAHEQGLLEFRDWQRSR